MILLPPAVRFFLSLLYCTLFGIQKCSSTQEVPSENGGLSRAELLIDSRLSSESAGSGVKTLESALSSRSLPELE